MSADEALPRALAALEACDAVRDVSKSMRRSMRSRRQRAGGVSALCLPSTLLVGGSFRETLS
jgi:hypothetical protein